MSFSTEEHSSSHILQRYIRDILLPLRIQNRIKEHMFTEALRKGFLIESG